ncbi:MAG: tetratricopeptide repeat protein [Planctomycetes bacterium]|nr:tetratricopeptide repeat protein [Planctomycetota bacterium]
MRKPIYLLYLVMVLAGAVALAGCQPSYSAANRAVEQAAATYLAGDNEEAVRLYTDFLGSNPGSALSAEGFLGRGNAYYKLGKYTLAESDFRSCAGMARDRSVKAQATLGLGHAVFAQQRYSAAEKIYLKVLRSYRGLVAQDEVSYRLGVALARQAKWDDARIYLNDVVSRWPSGEFARRAKAKLACVTGRYFTVQVGAFTSKKLADAKAAEIDAKGFEGRVQPIDIDGVPGYAVRSGSFAVWQGACAAATKLQNAGFSTYTLP